MGRGQTLGPTQIGRKRTQGTQKMKTINELCDTVRETSYAIHLYHGHGHLEKVYENALANRLRKAGFEIRQQHPLNVYDEDGTLIGEYFADLLIEGRLIVELKACRALADEHTAQLLGYLKSAKIEDGLLVNFGSYKFQIKKYAMSRERTKGGSSGLMSVLSAFLAFFCGHQ
jgi:GxxExxY protein